MKANWLRVLALLLCASAVAAIAGTPARAQISGAVFTTNAPPEETIDENLYAKKTDVYLNGGPRKPGASGLPPGFYYVQVTEPNGTLLGTSADNRIPGGPFTPVEVGGDGRFVEAYRLWDIVLKASKLGGNGNGNGISGYDTTSNNGGEYKVWISMNPGFPNSESKTDNFKVKTNGPMPPEQTEIRVLKSYDFDGDGAKGDPAVEPPIPNWHIELRRKSDNSPVACGLTDAGGEIEFLVDADGTEYVVVETLVEPYVNTTPLSVDVTATSDPPVVEVVFGNVCLEEAWGLGRTPGFWQASNQGVGIVGADLPLDCNPAWRVLLNGLCLANPDGTSFTVPVDVPFTLDDGTGGFDAFDDWIVGNGAEENMAYILSRQLAAIALNGECGFMAYSPVLYVPCGEGIVDLDELIGYGSALLCANPYTGNSSDPDVIAARADQEALKNCLDAINNNVVPVLVVSPTPCPCEPVPCP